jgi:hypothetical protein
MSLDILVTAVATAAVQKCKLVCMSTLKCLQELLFTKHALESDVNVDNPRIVSFSHQVCHTIKLSFCVSSAVSG